MTKGSKTQKKYFLLHFDPINRIWTLCKGVEDKTSQRFYLRGLSA